MNRSTRYIVNSAWKTICARDARGFQRNIRRVEETQAAYLKKLISDNRGTVYGQRHRFDRVDSVASYQRTVPIVDYDEIRGYIERIKRGEQDILTKEQVRLLEPSSGTRYATKLIPYTDRLRREFQAGIRAWIHNLYDAYPKLMCGSSYWVITPRAPGPSDSDCRLPIGFDEDASYLASFDRKLVSRIMAIPGDVAAIKDIDNLRYVTLLFLLAADDLCLISLWDPTFLPLLLANISRWNDALRADLSAGQINPPKPLPPQLRERLRRRLHVSPERRKRLGAILASLAETPEDIWPELWPKLELISCWADSNASDHARELSRLLPQATIQAKGLLATEAFVTVPIQTLPECAVNHVLLVGSHFFEFEDRTSGEIYQPHDAEIGRQYAVIVTTGGGLYRYRLNDIVEVTGWLCQAPCLKFVGKTPQIVSLVGEKLHEAHVEQTLNSTFSRFGLTPDLRFLAPETRGAETYYTLFVDDIGGGSNHARVADAIDAGLRENYHYQWCRELGQLKEINVVEVGSSGKAAYLHEKGRHGKLSTVKFSRLEQQRDWRSALGAY